MTPDSEPESRFCSNDIFPISSASNGAQKFQKGFPHGPPHLAGGGFSDWPEAYPLGYHPQPGSLLGPTHRMWGWLSCRALARKRKSQAAFFILVALDFHYGVRAFSSCSMQVSLVMVLRVSCPTDVGS